MPNQFNVSIVGGESLLGRELRDQLTDQAFPGRIHLIGSAEDAAVLTTLGGEAAVVSAMDSDRVRHSNLIFMAGPRQSARKAFDMLPKEGARPVVIDLSSGLEDYSNARLRAPLVEPDGFEISETGLHVIAHPAAAVLASIMNRAHQKYPIRRSVVQAFEPASERGQSGIGELQSQTSSLLSFRGLSKEVFDAQLSFNMLPRYGSDAPEPLEDIEQRIDRHLASLLARGAKAPMPSLRLVQAPVFHGYSISIWTEFESNPGPIALGEALASAQIEVRSNDLDAPTNVGSVGQSGSIVGLIEVDRNYPKAVWIWAVADNFRVSVDNAIAVAKRYLP